MRSSTSARNLTPSRPFTNPIVYSPWYKAHADAVLELISDNVESKNTDALPKDILDIGSGTGYLLRAYCQRYPNAQGLGVDIAPNMAVIANRKAQDAGLANLKFLVEDWEDIDIDTLGLKKLNTIVCANALHYFSDPLAATQKMAQALKSGKLIIVERDKSRSLLTLFWNILHRTVIKDHVVFYDQNALFNLLEKAGFQNIRVSRRLKRYFWKGKLFTHIIIISCQLP